MQVVGDRQQLPGGPAETVELPYDQGVAGPQVVERGGALFELAAYTGLRRSELAGLEWADVDLVTRRVHVRQAQVDDVLDDTKSEDSERIITLDRDRAESLRAWRKSQLAERLAWGAEWTDSGRGRTGHRSGPPGSASGSTRSPRRRGFRRSPFTA